MHLRNATINAMNLLAIETSTESCSVALLSGDTLLDRSEVAPRRHAELVLPMAEALLAEAGLLRSQLDVIAVGRGPGAFTGVRLGVSMAQGLAFALGVQVVTISSLAALASGAPEGAAAILAVIDARMGEVYAGSYRRRADGGLESLIDDCVCAPDMVEVPARETVSVIGTGWSAYGDVLAQRLAAAPAWADGECYPQARNVARLAAPVFAGGGGEAPELALPVYLRDKVAQTLVERGRA